MSPRKSILWKIPVLLLEVALICTLTATFSFADDEDGEKVKLVDPPMVWSTICYHDFLVTEYVPPTCSNSGYEIQTCPYCGETRQQTIPATGNHQWVDSVVGATCESVGYTVHTCAVCGSSYTDGQTPALGHAFGGWTTIGAPTCANDGSESRTCSNCGATETRSIPAAGNHQWATTSVAATCESGGYTLYTCSTCGSSHKENETPALGHNFKGWTTKKSATCAAEGVMSRACRTCGYVETQSIPKTDTHGFKNKTVKATCEEDGYTEHVCQICGYSYKDNITPKLGHNWGDWHTITAPSCSREGTAARGCKTCNKSENKALPKNDTHAFVERTVAATCKDEGYVEHTCKSCGYSYKDNMTPKTTTHTYVESVVASDCKNQGYTLHKCRICGDEYKDNFTPTKSHFYKITETTATCEHEGVQTYTCLWCGDTYQKEAPKQSCRTSDKVVIPATPTSHGESYYTCKWCGKQSTPTKIEHYYVATEAHKPNGSSKGGITFTCTICGDSYTTSTYDESLDYGIELSKTDKSDEEKLNDIFTASNYYKSDCVIASARIANMCRSNGIECKIVSINDVDQQARFNYSDADKERAAQTGFYPNGIGINHHWVICTIDGKTYEFGL